jgi:hypothetical protein
VVREHFKGDLGTVKMNKLRAALTTFPMAKSVLLEDKHAWRSIMEEEAQVDWLREGGRGSHLVKVQAEGDAASYLVHAALREGALPSLKAVNVTLYREMLRASLTEGFLGGMHELHLYMTDWFELEAELAALGLVRQLPALVKLDLEVHTSMAMHNAQWPPFIPPSLKTLFLDVKGNSLPSQPLLPALLPALPGMLEASGARLERLEVLVTNFVDNLGDGLVHVAQALRRCSSTLKAFLLTTAAGDSIGWEAQEYDFYAGEKAALRVDWGDLLVGVSACRELQVLVLPDIIFEPLFPQGVVFGCLVQLELWDYKRELPPDAGVVGLWELVASGGLPALAKLEVTLRGHWGGLEEMRTRVAPGLEAVAGTLTHLCFGTWDGGPLSDQVETGYEFGVRWASCGGSRISPSVSLTMAEPITPWPRAWPPAGESALSPCCGG